MTDVGELLIRIKADISQLQSQMTTATETTKKSASEMSEAFRDAGERITRVLENLGIAIAAREIIEFGKSALESADNIYIMSQRTGVAVETLSALNIPLKQNGSNIDEFSSSMKFMSRNIELAAEGNQSLIAKFDSLGLSVTKLKSLTPEQQFDAIAKALAGVDDQGKFTADGMAILGRGFQNLAPLIRTTSGNIQEFVQQQEALGNTLTKDEVDKVHEYDDAWVAFWEHMKVKAVEGTLALAEFAEASRKLRNEDTLSGVGGVGSVGKGTLSENRPTTVSAATFVGDNQNYPAKAYDPKYVPSAKGNNDDLTSGDAKTPELGPYIQSLKDEAEALSESKLALVEYKAEKEGAAKAQQDFKNGLRDSPDLTSKEKDEIDAATEAYQNQKDALAELQKEEQKHIQMVAQLESKISGSLADIALNYKSFGATVSGVFQQIAKQIIEMQITTPLVESLGGTKGNPGLLSGLGGSITKMLGFADGGSPPVGVPSIVGENGPEIFVPNTAGTVIPNSKMGGTTVIVQQTINMSPGLPETVNAAVMNAAPYIAAQAHASVFTAIQRGGDESRIVGRRS